MLLLGIAMPLKYGYDMPEAVAWTGLLHGLLFVLYLIVIAYGLFSSRLTFVQSLLGVVSAFIPFGPFVYDRWLTRQRR
jgi:integral membrane protein